MFSMLNLALADPRPATMMKMAVVAADFIIVISARAVSKIRSTVFGRETKAATHAMAALDNRASTMALPRWRGATDAGVLAWFIVNLLDQISLALAARERQHRFRVQGFGLGMSMTKSSSVRSLRISTTCRMPLGPPPMSSMI